MAKLKLSEDEVRSIFFEEHEDFKTVQEGEWTQEYKYQICDVVVEQISTGKCYEFGVSRTGSYHTDWEYNFWETELLEVEFKTETIVVSRWVPVNDCPPVVGATS